MQRYYYKKDYKKDYKKTIFRLISFGLFLIGVLIITYIFLPLISWQIYFAPVFASQNIVAPIPKNTVVSSNTLQTLIANTSQRLSGIDYTNAQNWFPNYKYQKTGTPKLQFYTISIPKLKIKNAIVSTVDTDLAKHLVNYIGTALPPERGNAVVFGHSTLPQLYEDKNYKTIFSRLYELKQGDEIIVNDGKIDYKYIVESVVVVDPDNTTVLEQNYNDSFLTLVTCTPPGTIWKRLIVRSRIEKI